MRAHCTNSSPEAAERHPGDDSGTVMSACVRAVRFEATVRIVVNPGSNLTPALLARYRMAVAPHHFIVEGAEHDMRQAVSLQQVDTWVEQAAEHPYVLGTSAAEFTRLFTEVGRDDPDLLVVTTSRKVIQTHAAAVSAARTLESRANNRLRIRVVDSGTTDVGAGLVTLMGAVAHESGMDMDTVAELLVRFASDASLRLHVATMDNLIKGGRAGFLRGWLANVLGRRPILKLRDGELAVAETIGVRTDPVQVIVDTYAEAYEGRPLWVGIAHGNCRDQALRLSAALRERLPVEFEYFRPFSPSIYLHVGPGALACVAAPVDTLGWTPALPVLGPDP